MRPGNCATNGLASGAAAGPSEVDLASYRGATEL